MTEDLRGVGLLGAFVVFLGRESEMLVLCAGMPKAGSTLQYNVCKELLGDRLAIDYGWVPAPRLAKGFQPAWGGDDGGHSVLKCHQLPGWVDDVAGSAELRIVSTYRDLRDVAASAMEFEPDRSFDKILEVLEMTVREVTRLEGLGTCLIQRYETMTSNLESAVREIGSYLDCPATDDEVKNIVERWNVQAAKKRATQANLASERRRRPRLRFRRSDKDTGSAKQWDSETLLRPTHISTSEGRPGRFEGILSRDETGLIERRFGEWLREHAYA